MCKGLRRGEVNRDCLSVSGTHSSARAGEGYSAFMPADFTCRTKSQCPNAPSPATDPRKLCAPVRSRLKHGSNGRPLSVAQTASHFTLSVQGGTTNDFTGPEPLL